MLIQGKECICVQAKQTDQKKLAERERSRARRISYLKGNYDLYLMMIPALLFFLIFKYVPIGGLQLAFKKYNFSLGIMGSPWVGFSVFEQLFKEKAFWRAVWNTVWLNLIGLLVVFPMPVLFALLLNELKSERYKRVSQSISYLPHFISWVIVYGIIVQFNQENTGLFNIINKTLGQPQRNYLTDKSSWLVIFFLSNIWKESGWQAIMYLSALSAIDPGLYEAAAIDGAGRFKSAIHVTLPGIRGTVAIILILQVGKIMTMGFEKPYLFENQMVKDIASVLSVYIYQQGVQNAKFELTTAAGMFQGVVNYALLLLADWGAKLCGEEGLFGGGKR